MLKYHAVGKPSVREKPLQGGKSIEQREYKFEVPSRDGGHFFDFYAIIAAYEESV
jgi:hypothetical protein